MSSPRDDGVIREPRLPAAKRTMPSTNCCRRGSSTPFPALTESPCARFYAQTWAISQFVASVRAVKKRVGHGGTCTPRKKFASTLSTGDFPKRAMREARQGIDHTARASRLTEATVAISTSMACCSCSHITLTCAIAARASSTSICTPGSQRKRRTPSALISNSAFEPSIMFGSSTTPPLSTPPNRSATAISYPIFPTSRLLKLVRRVMDVSMMRCARAIGTSM